MEKKSKRKEKEKERKTNLTMLTGLLHYCTLLTKEFFVVATTRHSRINDLTTSKALQWAIK